MPDIISLPLVVSVSGGRTSALMAKLLKDRIDGKRKVVFIFANTSKERPETIKFLRQCDDHFGLNLVLVEAVVHPERGVGTTHRVVSSFAELKMDGSVFEAVIQKYGIPNKNFPHCTRELKAAPIRSYLRSFGINKYVTAIGYRADEPKRLNWQMARQDRHYYPLAETWQVRKPDVLAWWRRQTFDLELAEHEGNCDLCWKKSTNKLLTLIEHDPYIATWWHAMETKYSSIAFDGRKDQPEGTVFFREGTSAAELVSASRLPFKRFAPGGDQLGMFSVIDDIDDGCAESCEPFGAAP